MSRDLETRAASPAARRFRGRRTRRALAGLVVALAATLAAGAGIGPVNDAEAGEPGQPAVVVGAAAARPLQSGPAGPDSGADTLIGPRVEHPVRAEQPRIELPVQAEQPRLEKPIYVKPHAELPKTAPMPSFERPAVVPAMHQGTPGAAPTIVLAQNTTQSTTQKKAPTEPAPAKPAAADKGKAPGDLSATEVAERIQNFYKKTSDFQSPFRQTYTDAAAGESKTSTGTVYFKKPGKMRWDYDNARDPKKRDKVLVSDGNAFWIYEFEFQQVFKQCLAESQLPTSLRFLMGEGDLLSEFDVEFTPGSTAKRPELKLTPRQPTGQYRELRFVLNPETFQVVRTTIFDPYGNTNEIEFTDIKVNRNLPDSGFKFEPPRGARLLNPQKSC